MVVFVDECFEEVIDMECMVKGEVIVLIFDCFVEDYIMVVEFVIECVKCFVEFGCDVVVLFDLIICFGCVYNLVVLVFGCVFIGGVDVLVLYLLKCFFGVVCNIENGGLFMIFVMVFVEIGFKMDEVIFEEFKGIGNSELCLLC